MSDIHIKNVFSYFTNVVANGLMGNISTIQTHSETLKALSDANEDLTKSWTTDDKKNSTHWVDQKQVEALAGLDPSIDPTKHYNMYEIFQFIINFQKDHPGEDPHNKYWAGWMDGFCQTNLGTGADLNLWSSALGIMAMRALSSVYTSDAGSPSPGDMNMINQFSSLISSQGQNEEGIGQNATKTETSVAQQDSSAQQPWADAANAYNGVGSNDANLLQQSY